MGIRGLEGPSKIVVQNCFHPKLSSPEQTDEDVGKFKEAFVLCSLTSPSSLETEQIHRVIRHVVNLSKP